MRTYQVLKIFISSPGDVAQERNMAEDVINQVNASCKDTLGITLEIASWEKLPPLTPNLSDERIQDIINKEIRDCNIFLLILYKRYGSIEPAQKKSNTQREVETAIDMLLKNKVIMFLSYFRNIPEDKDPGEQQRKVEVLRQELQDKGIWFCSYDSPEEFKERLTHDLYRTILKFRLSTSKHRALLSFWQLGVMDRPIHPRLAIIYPPVDRTFLRKENPDKLWCERLVPHIVFEDFKALQKIEKSLRLIGFREFRFYNTANMPADIQDMNRVWVCVPRNLRARHQLNLYGKDARFNFLPRRPQSEAKLRWRYSPNSESFIEIHSPLSKYLREQRGTEPGGEWKGQKGRIIAKDFAVLSRFSDSRNKHSIAEGTLKDYFIAGIRGLGTWGAAWFIDRRYNTFKNYQDNDEASIQLLLEVTYSDERIFDVRDVSEESESYFKKQNSTREIKKIITEYQQR